MGFIMTNYSSPVSESSLKFLCDELSKHTKIKAEDYDKYQVKKGLRNQDGTGVMAGLTRICTVDGYYLSDGERVPRDGRLIYRGFNVVDIINNCAESGRYGFEETVWLLLMGCLPTAEQLDKFTNLLAECRNLPENFIEDMIMKAPSPNVMNKLERAVLSLYSYDDNPDDTSVENVMRQCIQLIAQIPIIMAYAYQVKRRNYYHKSMFIHNAKPTHKTAQAVLSSSRADRSFTEEESRLLDLCLILHAEHGGGNNSTFAVRTLTSSGTDTYSAIAAGIGSLKGPKHGGANIKVAQMLELMHQEVKNTADENQVADYLVKLINKEKGDHSGLIYGMGHAVYTVSDPRALILKKYARKFAEGTEHEAEFTLLETIERLTPQIFATAKGDKKRICSNVDLYSGLVYKMLGIPEDLYTPLFTVARVAGWSAHRIEELLTGGRIIRPAYKSVASPRQYVSIEERDEDHVGDDGDYIPSDER